MILEAIVLNIKQNEAQNFEAAFKEASPILKLHKGYINHSLHRCIEVQNQYILQIQWETLDDHTIGFRQSPHFSKWKALLHHFYDPTPTVLHYEPINKS